LRGLPESINKEFVVGQPTQEEGYEFDFVLTLFRRADIQNYEKAI
jgi:hypothetical protein